jgi:hypothetical protein
MNTLELTKTADAAGSLHVTLPGQEPNRAYRITVSLEPAPNAGSPVLKDEHGWPAGFFDLAGSWEGEFVQESEGE